MQNPNNNSATNEKKGDVPAPPKVPILPPPALAGLGGVPYRMPDNIDRSFVPVTFNLSSPRDMAELREKHQRVMADLGDDPAEDEEEDATAWIQGPNGVAVPATISADEWKQQELHGLRTRSFWAQMHQVQATSGQPNLQQIQQLLQQFRANPTPESHPSDAASKDIKPQ